MLLRHVWTPHVDRKNAYYAEYAPGHFGDIWRLNAPTRGRPMLHTERWRWTVTVDGVEVRRGEEKSMTLAKISATNVWKSTVLAGAAIALRAAA